MSELQQTESWLKKISGINRELDFERENIEISLRRIDELEAQKEEMHRIISKVSNPTYKTILHKRYVQGKHWEDISAEIHYERQHVHRLHQKAVAEVHFIRTGEKNRKRKKM